MGDGEEMPGTRRPYVPIDCGIHDRLEALATMRRRCTIVYRDDAGNEVEAVDVIEDVYTRGREEFVRLGSGPVVRLDALVSVDGIVVNAC